MTGDIIFQDDPTVAGAETVPADADVVAAFLHFELITTSQDVNPLAKARFRGHPIGDIAKPIGSATLDPTTAPCFSSGGGSQAVYTITAYRVDVLRFLPVPEGGKRLINASDLQAQNDPAAFGPHTVTLPERGTGNQTPSAAGATLTVLYRRYEDPLQAIVLYDGLDVKKRGDQQTTQTIRGFYQSSATGLQGGATYTRIGGSGAPNATDAISFNGGQPIATNPFVATASPASDRAWNNPTYDVTDRMSSSGADPVYGQQVTTTVTHGNASPYDCITTVAEIVRTDVPDDDDDGLLNPWEEPSDDFAFNYPLTDPDGRRLPNLKAIGTTSGHKDVLVEVGYFKSTGAYSTPLQDVPAGESHLPSAAAIKKVGDAFKNAPVHNPDGKDGIRLWVDVGSHHQGQPYVIPFKRPNSQNVPQEACLPSDASGHTLDSVCLARGGESIEENLCDAYDHDNDPSTAPQDCLFDAFGGVVGWKGGFAYYRDQPLNYSFEQDCVAVERPAVIPVAITPCQRRFDAERVPMFHYGLFAHALGLPRDDDPETMDVDESRWPKNWSGIGDSSGGGGDFMVTLGLWIDLDLARFTMLEAATWLHEMGHTGGLRHGGAPDEPNCKPNYLSVMNYTFQLHGLTVGQANFPVPNVAPGDKVVDFSRQRLGVFGSPGLQLPETGLRESAPLVASDNQRMAYRTSWYAPATSDWLAVALGTDGVIRHCDGSRLSDAEMSALSLGTWAGMVRVEGASLTSPVDWNANALTETNALSPQDVNFSGGPNTSVDPDIATDGPFDGFDDWARFDLRQIGARRKAGNQRIYERSGVTGAVSLGTTWIDFGAADQGYGDGGYGDGGYGDGGYGDGGYGDGGYGDGGYGDGGYGDGGYGDGGYGDGGAPRGDIDFDTLKAQDNAPRNVKATSFKTHVNVDWIEPIGEKGSHSQVASYRVYRVTGNAVTPANIGTKVTVGNVWPTPHPTTAVDDFTVKNNTTYTYFLTAVFIDGRVSRVSNFAVVTKRP